MGFCNDPALVSYVGNLTSDYTDQIHDVSTMLASVVMLVLTLLLYTLAVLHYHPLLALRPFLHSTTRLLLTTVLSLFLPVMSYLFSEAKNAAGAGYSSSNMSEDQPELPLRAQLILAWMLLVELQRKKMEGILTNAGMLVDSITIERAARITWLGYLVFFNLQRRGLKATFGILWLLAAAKLVQRVVIDVSRNRSFAYNKSAHILTDYMAQMLKQERHVGLAEEDPGNPQNGASVLKNCKYAVMGEKNLVKEEGPHGYHLKLKNCTDNGVITVGKVWERHDYPLGLKRLCLSYALSKLLRRRFEDLPITEAETCDCRKLIFEGLCKDSHDPAAVLFQVLNDEVHFLIEYYHSVVPFVLASTFFLIVNYILFPLIVFSLCLMTIVLCGNGDVPFAFSSIRSDVFKELRIVICLINKDSPSAFLCAVDILITCILIVPYIYQESWEFFTFFASQSQRMADLYHIATTPQNRCWPNRTKFLMCLLMKKFKMSDHSKLDFRQFSVLGFCRLSLVVRTNVVPKEAKLSIMKSLEAHDKNTQLLSNGTSALKRYEYWWACHDSITEVMLIWHIATSLFERKYPEQTGTPVSSDRKVATRLSKYCAYLVAFHPELLPDNRKAAKWAYKAMEEELKMKLGCWGYYFWPEATRHERIIQNEVQDEREPEATVLRKGVKLGKKLMEEAKGNEGQVWKLLAELWTELIVYAAPSSSEAQVKGHEQALEQGHEFITLLWALATHTGISRPPVVPRPNIDAS